MQQIRAEMVASVWEVFVSVGEAVEADTEIAVLESMKMEIPVTAPVAGTVSAVHVQKGDVVQVGDLIAEIEQ